jgi:hypothetical protein
MAIEYVCRYCHVHMGRIDSDTLTESELGFDQLTPEERKDIITSDIFGNCYVHIVCESCQEVLEGHPERSLLPSLFH